MYISITNAHGKPLSHAVISFMPERADHAFIFDQEHGWFVVPPLEPGTYTVYITCEGYEPETRDLIIGKDAATVLDIVLINGIHYMGIRHGRIRTGNITAKLNLVSSQEAQEPVEEISGKLLSLLEQRTMNDNRDTAKKAVRKNDKIHPTAYRAQIVGQPGQIQVEATETGSLKDLQQDIKAAGLEVHSLTLYDGDEVLDVIVDTLWILFTPDTSDERIYEILKENDLEAYLPIEGLLHAKKKAYCRYTKLLSWDYIETLNRLYDYPEVDSLDADYIPPVEPTGIQSGDEIFPLQWSLHLARVPDAWRLLYNANPQWGYGSADVIVDIYDTGIRSNTTAGIRSVHPDLNVNLQGATLKGIDGVPIHNHKIYSLQDFNTKTPTGVAVFMTSNNNIVRGSHGGAVAGITGAGASPDPAFPQSGIAGNEGVAGVAPNIRLMGSTWGNMPNPQWYNSWYYLAGLVNNWVAGAGGYPVGQLFPPYFNTPANPGPGFHVSNHSHSWPSIPSFAPGSTEADMADAIVSFGRSRRGAIIMFASGNDDDNINLHTRIAQHEKIIIVAGSSIGPRGFEERTSYSNYGAVVPAAGFNGPAEYAEIDFCAPTNHHAAWGNNLANGPHYFHMPGINRGVITTELTGNGNTDALAVAVAAVAGGTKTITVNNGAGFNAGDPVLIGDVNASREESSIYSVVGNVLTLIGPIFSAYPIGTRVEANSASNTPYSNAVATTLNNSPAAGTKVVKLVAIAGFNVGMAVKIGATPVYPAINNYEAGYIESVDVGGSKITLRDPLKFDHNNGEPIFGGTANITDSFSGTSAACPFASGVMALTLSANSHLTFWEARDILKRTALPIDLRMQPAPGTVGVNVAWVDIGNNPVTDVDGLLITTGGAHSVTNANNLHDPERTEIVLDNVAGLTKGQAIIFGAESTAVSFPTNKKIQVVNAADFKIGQSIEINAGPLTHLSQDAFIGSITINLGNTNGFRIGQVLQIGTGGGAESATILSFPNNSTDIQVTAALTMNHAVNTQVTLDNAVTRNITAVDPGTNTITIDSSITTGNYPLGGGNPNVIVRVVNTELAVIKSINGSTIVTDPLVHLPAAGTPVRGGRTPHYSYALGSGRLDAYEAVNEAQNYNHDDRDLMVRNYMGDNGTVATNTQENPIDSPDIWVVNGVPAPGPLNHGAAHTPANAQTSGDALHEKALRSAANVGLYTRIYNRGTKSSFDYSAHIYLALKDVDVDTPLLLDDYIDGPTTDTPYSYIPFTSVDPLSAPNSSFNLNNTGNGVHPGTMLVSNNNSSPAAYGGSNTFLPAVAAGNGIIYTGSLPQANRPRLPYSYVVVRTKAQVAAVDSIIPVENTRGFANGQQILIGRPADANYRVATINAAPTVSSITIAGTAGNVYPAGTLIIRLEAVQTTLTAQANAGVAGDLFSTLNVASTQGFKLGNYVLSGVPGAAGNGIHRVVRIVRHTATATSQIIVEPALPALLANATQITQIGGRLNSFVLAEVTPHDGLLAGSKPEDNNNISYKRINFEHEILLRDSTGNAALPAKIQVTNAGTNLGTDFRVYVRDADNFGTEGVVLTVTRKLINGNYESATYRYKTAAPAGWEETPAAAWLTMTAPKVTATNAAAAGNQTDVYFAGTFQANNTVAEVQFTVNVPGNDPHPLGAQNFITTASFATTIYSVSGMPGINDPNLQNQTGMPGLAGTQTLHAFADMTNLSQPANLQFGAVDDQHFRLTSSFANPGQAVNAFAVVDGIVFIQKNPANNTVNLVLKPLKQSEIGFSRVKYFIYRGLMEEDFFTTAQPDNLIENNPLRKDAHFVDSVINTQHALHPNQPVPLTSLGWDPTNQQNADLLDDFFFNANPDHQLPVVKRGMTLGRFKSAALPFTFGFEIVLAEGSYPLTLQNIRAMEYILDVSGIADANEKAAKREEILNYIDPAAYYGMHFLSGIRYPVLPDPNPATIDNTLISKADLYTKVVKKFATKNTLYVDVRNENGYSYNYYGNYTQGPGTDQGKNICIGYLPLQQQPLVASVYGTQQWPLITYNNENTPETTPEDMSAVFMQLSTADNGNPIVYFEYGNAISGSTDNNYTEGSQLLETFAIAAITPATNTITITGNVPGLAVGSQFNVIMCDDPATNSVYKVTAIAPNAGTPANTDITVEAATLAYDPANGATLGSIHFNRWTKVIAMSHPNQPAVNAGQKVNVAHMVKLRYFRQNFETGKKITAIDQPGKKFTLAGTIPQALTPGDNIVLINATTGNNGTYTIAAGGVQLVAGNTEITVTAAIPAAFSAVVGANNGSIIVRPTRVPAAAYYADQKFGSLNAITRQFTVSNISNIAGLQYLVTISGNFVDIIMHNATLSVIDGTAHTTTSCTINGIPVLNAGNTDITITAAANLTTVAAGKTISVTALPWRTDQLVQWISGFDFRYLDAERKLTDGSGVIKPGFSYMGQTGVAIEQDRMIFNMTPLTFFTAPAKAYSPNVINMNGGTATTQSFWQLMRAQNQALVLNATLLVINPGPVTVRVFDFVDNRSDKTADDLQKSNFLALCITRSEFERLKQAADAAFGSLHDIYMVLRRGKVQTDVNNISYKTFEVAVSGYSKNAPVVASEVYPATPVTVYALTEDSVVFTSKDFSDTENTDFDQTNYEESVRLKADQTAVYALNPGMVAFVNTFNADLSAQTTNYAAIKTLVQTRAQQLWTMAVAAADATGTKPYDDRQLYWARLHMRNAIREHNTLKTQFKRTVELIQLIEEYSRGFRTVNFAAAPAGAKKILVTGFDPFFLDKDVNASFNPKQSNPSGAIALHVHGKTITQGAKTAYIQTMVFPVRFADFDAGIVEKMIRPYMSGPNKVDMIITCSQDIVTHFNVDRFASQFRDVSGTPDNENRSNVPHKFYKITPEGKVVATSITGLPQFIQTTLPAAAMAATLGNTRVNTTDQIVVYNQAWKGTQPNGAGVQNQYSWDADDHPNYNPANVEPGPAANIKALKGSGGEYLSNEIFYRVSLMRVKIPNSVAKTGHLHTPWLQPDNTYDFSQADTQTLVQHAITILKDALATL